MLIVLPWFILTITHFSSSANILVINPSVSYSHQVAFFQLWERLSLRGHQVTSITTYPINNPKLKNLTELDIIYIVKEVLEAVNISSFIQNSHIWNTDEFIDIFSHLCSMRLLIHEKLQDIINGHHKFDVVLSHFWYPEFLALGKVYNCPTISFTSYYLSDYFHYSVGNPLNPVSHPHMIMPFHPPLNFGQRVISTIHSIFRWYKIIFNALPRRQELINKHFNVSMRIEDLMKDVDMVFVNVHPVLQEVRALGPATINIGYDRQSLSSAPLKEDLKEFMDQAKDGFVYFSLGSNVKSKDLDKHVLRTIMEAITEIPCKFLYKYEDDKLDIQPDNVKLIKWAPQYDILRHPNIKVFVTQGGFQSMEEAIYSAVPMVVIPFFVDQEHNGNLMKSKGIAQVVNRRPLKKEELVKAITEVLTNTSYKNKITRLRDLALDVPMTGLEKAIWWIEYVIRNKGAKHLRNPAADVPLYQYFLLDVIGFLLLVILAFVLLLYLLIKKVIIKRLKKTIKIKYKKDE